MFIYLYSEQRTSLLNSLLFTAPSALLILTLALISCEEVTIFAERERAVNDVIESQSFGSCTETSDCPQWTCVRSECVEGLCVPSRTMVPSVSLERIELENQLVSISMDGDLLFGLEGEPSQERHPLTIGEGSSVINFSLSSPVAGLDDDPQTKRDYEMATWTAGQKWTPRLERLSLTPSINVDEEPMETRTSISIRGITAHNGKIWLHGGDELRDLWWGEVGQEPSDGQYFRLAASAQGLVVDQDEAWVSVFDKGVERLDLSARSTETLNEDDEANARFNTPGRALSLRAGRSIVAVADGYAGLSLFSKRGLGGLSAESPNRRLITPPQELSTEGRTLHLDLIEDRIISAELGLGVSITRVNASGGLEREWTIEVGGSARWVHWIDSFTALVWVDGRGLLVFDLLNQDQAPVVIAELGQSIDDSQVSTASVWTASDQRFALLSPDGRLYHGVVGCSSP